MRKTAAALLAAAIAVPMLLGLPTVLAQEGGDTGPVLEIVLTFNQKIFPRKFGVGYPTCAVWVRDAASGDVRTVYLTRKLAYDKWIFAKQRPSAAPVWYGEKKREVEASGPLDLDAISSATPTTETHSIRWPVPDKFRGGSILVFVEANVSFDYNDHYPKGTKRGDANYNGYNGQPSVIWRAEVETGDAAAGEIKPVIAGRGHVLGSNHEIDPDLSTVTTAKDLFLDIRISYAPGS